MIYTLFSFLIWLLALPFLAVLALKKKYHKSLPARFLLFKNPKFNPCDVHFHACSLGEVNALKNLISNFENIAITTTTDTGFAAAKQITQNSRFLPFENLLPFWLEKAKVTVIFEAELWLNLVRSAKKNGSFVVLLNARISDKSYKNYLRFKFYYNKIFENIDLVLAQSERDKTRLSELGAKNIIVAGNIKSANSSSPSKILPKFQNRTTITIASTHEGEEELILAGLKNFAQNNKNFKFILAPRHPARFEHCAKIAKIWTDELNLSFEKFSENKNFKSDFILLDTIGELINFYAISDIVILGGSFVPNIGGHNPIEPASFGAKIISGRYFHNQNALYNLVKNIKICEASELGDALKNPPQKSEILQICDLERIIKIIKDEINARKSL
ncbi:lipid IV(A) 3-deoxy-D-manno-octulosonic acid transferase [Campylobacter sp. JMF_02 ED1]|uniref:lipid IV(A) 3-deoxy-D-manno-octulosonic acid transferase n=1 Tax=unclassified Campylobacter TaxID=2593542 RepID=UPI0022E9BD4B|nr:MULTISPECIES: lipid IV(A) 3-deoxy-D-manno-octulosonic acid transferase [unclassified Campylobacter]MDA3048835.1 lipid IV(A) 3-deoxy-D-manno-octulosonic acid transferase [Campylobacter sp. JMF_15 NE4]MDA3050454.1 lipid IV(A) 3-deoxy-D-manno-octulosonic acid transferase [Campylobacter sp. JMF_02 ED1]